MFGPRDPRSGSLKKNHRIAGAKNSSERSTLGDSKKYIGIDLHKEATAVAVVNASKKSPDRIDCRNQGSSIVQFVQGLRGSCT